VGASWGMAWCMKGRCLVIKLGERDGYTLVWFATKEEALQFNQESYAYNHFLTEEQGGYVWNMDWIGDEGDYHV